MPARSNLWFAACLVMASTLDAQMPDPHEVQQQVQRIVQERPREAEAAARAFLQHVGSILLPALDSLQSAAPDAYWMEVAQLTVQFGVMQKVVRRDSVRAQILGQMFGIEAHARGQQRAYRGAQEARRAAIRARLAELIARHLQLEDQLRQLEIADIERRLADVRAEAQRRREQQAELVRWRVEDIIRDATRPQQGGLWLTPGDSPGLTNPTARHIPQQP